MKTWHHVLLAVLLFFVYVLLVQQLYLILFQGACKEAGGTYQEAYRLCSGLTNQEADLGARMPYLRWLLLLGAPAILLAGLQLILHALVLSLVKMLPGNRGRQRRRIYRTPN